MSAQVTHLNNYQIELIQFLIDKQILSFGDFLLKSGRNAPYFFNFGKISRGIDLYNLGEIYAKHILKQFGKDINVLFGPAYKGIPLSVATSIALEKLTGTSVMYSFDRKEVKTRGEGGFLVGRQLSKGDNVIIVEDVVTAGTTLNVSIPMIRSFEGVNLRGVVIAVDRCEKSTLTETSNKTAVAEVQDNFELNVSSIINIQEVIFYLKEFKKDIYSNYGESINKYLGKYGA